ncbi:conserved hypothetical protein [Heterostelium album PN500]|uniref:Uncharacterized protein n=1 Tax=Heterostelium pallidum (strain ATCC 26659 / Pp 5 / PN500) TaxID=670386 RepID=D3AY85_HETP5|nr:conserved hypothetical protein [Heterostelium album PN500]EFA85912.1 conserved hypothetical protein [Heterostelium album PN500]|eukprot:XP_020438018.1 conserved hypothetical protein [Heterostelium album PN500]
MSSKTKSNKKIKNDDGDSKAVVEDVDELERIGNMVKKIEGNTIYRHFYTTGDLHKWLEENHKTAKELFICFYRKDSGKKSISWEEVLDVMLCFGWIDGVRRRCDDESYCNRYTPRRPTSNWSFINIKKVEKLIEENRMKPMGLEAFAKRKVATAEEAYEKENRKLTGSLLAKFKRSKEAYKFYTEQTDYYQKVSSRYVMNAVREETREQRLDELIKASSKYERMDRFKPLKQQKKNITKATTNNSKSKRKKREEESESESEESDYESDSSSSSSSDE